MNDIDPTWFWWALAALFFGNCWLAHTVDELRDDVRRLEQRR